MNRDSAGARAHILARLFVLWLDWARGREATPREGQSAQLTLVKTQRQTTCMS